MAMSMAGDWSQARKYFSFSEKYNQWKDFAMPARGVGLHALVVAEIEALCLGEHELERHPGWLGFAESAGKHPPLRGLLAVPIVGEDGLNYGLLQVSDKGDGTDFGVEDERRLRCLADAAAVGLDALRNALPTSGRARAARTGRSRHSLRRDRRRLAARHRRKTPSRSSWAGKHDGGHART
jgi:hypothetical protein